MFSIKWHDYVNHKNLVKVTFEFFFIFLLIFSSIAPMNTLTYSQSPASTTTTTIDLSQGYSSQQMNVNNQNDYSTLQPRYPTQPTINVPRQRTIIPNSKS